MKVIRRKINSNNVSSLEGKTILVGGEEKPYEVSWTQDMGNKVTIGLFSYGPRYFHDREALDFTIPKDKLTKLINKDRVLVKFGHPIYTDAEVELD